MKKKLFVLLLAGLISTAPAAEEWQQESEQTAKRPDPGLPVGQPAPLFALKDQNGNEVSLKALLKKGPVVVVFHRSADWCIYCKLQIVQLQRNLKEIETSGAQIVGISFDSTEILKRFAQRRGITFPLLSDSESKIIEAYGIQNKDAPERWRGIAYHATFVLDQEGIIRSKLFQVSYQERHAVDALLQALKEARETKVAGPAPEFFPNVVTTKETR